MNFRYEAFDRSGVRSRGVARAPTEADAVRRLAASGLTAVRLRATRGDLVRRRVPQQQVAHITYQLSVLISARIPIGDGIRGIAEQEQPGPLRDALLGVASRIESGGGIADAMAEQPAVFDPLYVAAIRAAEKTGTLVKVLEYLSEMLERASETRRQIRGALMYPLCVVSVLALAVAFLIVFVVPKFAGMFEERGVEIPFFTRLLATFGSSVLLYWYGYMVGAVGAAFAMQWLSRQPRVRLWAERVMHRVPFLRDVLIGLAMARFARVFGLCLGSGLGLIESLTMSASASGRVMLRADTDRMIAQVLAGGQLAGVLKGCAYLPPIAKRLLTSGEEAAELTRMCGIIARHYERETTTLSKSMATIIEPVLIVLIAAVVLVVALAIFSPMWNMVKLIG
ncbi:MAG: type II secretion system F family protein [Phycisphaerales bacterium]